MLLFQLGFGYMPLQSCRCGMKVDTIWSQDKNTLTWLCNQLDGHGDFLDHDLITCKLSSGWVIAKLLLISVLCPIILWDFYLYLCCYHGLMDNFLSGGFNVFFFNSRVSVSLSHCHWNNNSNSNRCHSNDNYGIINCN